MKTGAYWFKLLTDKEQEEFKVNFEKFNVTNFKRFEDYLKYKFGRFDSFICWAFVHANTKQGKEYWYEISQRKID